MECSGSLKQGLIITVLLGAEHKEKQLFIFCVSFMPSLVLIFSNSVEMVTLIEGVQLLFKTKYHTHKEVSSRLFGFVSMLFVPLRQMEKCLRYVVDAMYTKRDSKTLWARMRVFFVGRIPVVTSDLYFLCDKWVGGGGQVLRYWERLLLRVCISSANFRFSNGYFPE